MGRLTVVAAFVLAACTAPAVAPPSPTTDTTEAPLAAGSAPLAPTATPLVVPLKQTPCPAAAFDPAKTGFTGQIVWNGQPVAGLKVDAREPGAPGMGPVLATTVTAADGTFTFMGLPLGRHVAAIVPEQPGFASNSAIGGAEICPDRMAKLAPSAVQRTIGGLNVARGAFVAAAGPLDLRWSALAGADSYCVRLVTIDGAAVATGQCQTGLGTTSVAARVTTTSYRTPPLASGQVYLLAVWAFAGSERIGTLPKHSLSFSVLPLGKVGPCAAPFAVEDPSRPAFFFFQMLNEARTAEMAACWADDLQGDKLVLMRGYADTGGADIETLQAETPRADGTVPVKVILRWKETDVFGAWGSGQTKWLIMKKQADGRWAITATATALTR